ncbi:putative secreted protein (Por secretion system target) [Ulvibacter sp. MAR_2010_11]|uniref:type IX secretion system sortase PorU n=1 Tax=Ulvibacter sp. MAR_2010_11 TaxID=1250229 RepID=UPI000CC249A3|nr:type IX secretion system sortase PorU [Ulvibacter sp. MAR_2010_11]PKA83421.1 putative secreted protein (Por secretion system target) [Ulvibacter sp. MAR_2010_11]
MMRRILLLLCVIVLPFSMLAQTKNITIDWEAVQKKGESQIKKEKSISNDRDKYLAGINLNLSGNSISYRHQWEDNGFANPNSLTISNIKYGTLTSEELSKIDKSVVPQTLSYSIGSSRAREVIYTIVTISPIVKTGAGFQKVLSFSVSYTFNNSIGASPRMAINSSVLATGNWYKFKIDKTGIYKVDKGFLEDLGMNTNGINPRNLKIYGHGGKSLPLLNSLNTFLDLPENSIQVVGEADGSFDNGDYILFYGIGSLGYDAQNDTHENPYSDETYYYVTADGSPGLRVQALNEPTQDATVFIDQFNDYKFHEVNEISPGKVGRRWYGNRFDIESEQSYEFDFPNIVGGAPLDIVIKVASASETSTSMAVSINGATMNPLVFGTIGGTQLFSSARFNTSSSVVIPASGETVTIDLTYNNSGNPSSVGYLDYIRVEALRRLTGVSGQLQFRYNEAKNLSGVGEYQLTNATQFSQVWDVTNIGSISAKQNEANADTFKFKTTLGELRNYVAVNPNDFFSPIRGNQSVVGNQDLKGTIFNDESGNFKDIDYIIISPPFLIQPALRLANIHKDLNGLNVKVVTTDKIYEEFSSGKQDISAIRNFVRYVYENASSPDKRVKYLCLFGDASVDYKNRLANNNNIVPVFERLLSTHSLSSYMSDDFYGNLDINEGTIGGEVPDPITGNNLNDVDKLDVAVGRILADNVLLANQMVDKIKNYLSKQSYGNWRTNFVLISDDVDETYEFTELEGNLDALGDEISAQKPFINVKKIHTDAYQQETSAGGNRYPQVKEAIKNAIEVGALIVNYFGHGGEDGLAKEFIYTKEVATDLRNKDNYPCIVTVTCEFTKFDNPLRITAGELTFWNKEGGAICLVTTTRSIGVDLGVRFNQTLASELFGFGVNVPETPAEALRVSKNLISDDARRVIFFIGDPALHLAFPKKNIRITTLNGVPLAQVTEPIKALDRVTMEGEVVDEFGAVLTNYNGVLEAKVYDKNVQRSTLGNDGIRDGNGNLLILDFITLGEGLFNGQATVTNGTFEFEFVVPRDAQIPVDNGRVSLYAQRDNEFEDQTGVNLDIKVGGLNENAPEDNEGPLIRLFMNDESFVSGGITNDSPILIAKLEDENGINTASGIGHDMIAILDGDETNPIVVNEYYQAEVDDFTKGKTTYRLRDLEVGLHTLTFKAWDVYNNSSTADIQFIVAGDDTLAIDRVLNYPNPFVNYTEFWFNHNRPFEPLEVQVQVFTVTGKVVWTKNQIINTDGFLSRDIVWNGLDDFGDKIGKGVYVYKITVKSTLTNQRVEKFEKLVIL